MRSSKIFITIATVFLLAFFSGITLAEVKSGTITLSPRVGGYVFDSSERLTNGTIYELGIGKNLTANLGAEFVFGYIGTNTNDTHTYRNGYIFRVDGLYNIIIPFKPVVPYVVLGVGSITLEGDTRNNSGLLLNGGAGINVFITDTLAIRGDGRYIKSYYNDFDNPQNNYSYSVGVTYQFGN